LAFCAACFIFLLVISPRYAARQRRLEMQYQAHQERYRRQVEGEPAAQSEGQEGTVAPTAPGELIIPLWPLLGLFAALLAFTGAMLRRERRAASGDWAGGQYCFGRTAVTWLVESPWPVLMLGVCIEIVLAIVLVRTGRTVVLAAMVGVLVLTAGMLLVERVVVTRTEEVEDTLAAIGTALEANDLPAVMASIATDCPRRGEIQATLPRFVIREARVGGDLEVRFNPLLSPPTAVTYFTGRIAARDKRGEVPYEHMIRKFKVTLRKEGDRWLVADYADTDVRDGRD
jgi:hypothetical protein